MKFDLFGVVVAVRSFAVEKEDDEMDPVLEMEPPRSRQSVKLFRVNRRKIAACVSP